MNLFTYGNKAVLIVGVVLMVADSFVAIAHEFGAWTVGCLFCVGYSASAIRENPRIGKNLKRWLYAYLAIVFVLAVLLDDFIDSRSSNAYRPILSSTLSSTCSSPRTAEADSRPSSVASMA